MNNADKVQILVDNNIVAVPPEFAVPVSPEFSDDDYYRFLGNTHITPEILYDIYLAEFRGVKNEYLESLLNKYSGGNYVIAGPEDKLLPCDCCGFKTLNFDSTFDICHVCGWSGAATEPDEYSSFNNNTLLKAREEFFADLPKVDLANSMYFR